MQMIPSFIYLFVVRIMRVWQMHNLQWNWCVNDIKICMQSNFLKSNDDKTELLLVHPRHRQMSPLLSVAVGNDMILPTECARNIGVMFDHNLTMDQQITSICKSAFFHLSN